MNQTTGVIPTNVDFGMFVSDRYRSELTGLVQAANQGFNQIRHHITDPTALWDLYRAYITAIALAVASVSGGLKAAS